MSNIVPINTRVNHPDFVHEVKARLGALDEIKKQVAKDEAMYKRILMQYEAEKKC